MRTSLRRAFAAAMGAAVLTSGVAITAASPAFADAANAGIDFDVNKFIPPSGSDKFTFKVHLTGAYADKDHPAKVSVQYLRPDEADTSAHDASVTQLGAVATVPTDNKADVSGSIPVSSSDKPGDWKYRVGITQGDAASGTNPTYASWATLAIAKATRVSDANVDPDPVYLKSGKEIDVFVAFKLEKFGDEKITSVRLQHESSGDYYSLTTALEPDDSYHDSTAFDYSTATGDWNLKVGVSRGTKNYVFQKAFTVKKSVSKVKSKITLYASPTKVAKGKSVKLYGKVYRGTKAWAKKYMSLYFKKKGTSTWKFVGYIKSGSTGKYSKLVKPKYDGYWRLKATGTSYTYSSLSNYKFVDVR